ncbi:hypothetical protein, partial [Pseudopedobacter sp.]|uniref:hypothetical protein n=1 Tax=Pseudopedobacter sp. TaxID=1936787 RepID=UPI00333F9977
MKNIFTILLLLYVGNNLLLAQTPVLPTKDIANTPSNLLFKPNSENDLPHNVMGLTFTGASGHGTYVDNSVRIYKTATVNEQYFWLYTNST